jgi:hypothetical protein
MTFQYGLFAIWTEESNDRNYMSVALPALLNRKSGNCSMWSLDGLQLPEAGIEPARDLGLTGF